MGNHLLRCLVVLAFLGSFACKKDDVAAPGAPWDLSGKIVFSLEGGAFPGDVNMLDMNSSALTVSVLAGAAGEPRVDSGARMVVFTGFQAGMIDIFTTSTSGSIPIDLTPSPVLTDSWPDWSPDGGSIVFNRVYQDLKEALCIMDRSGGNLHNLTDTASLALSIMGRWSPDGRMIAFLGQTTNSPPPYSLYIIEPDGSGLVELDRAAITMPVWSPDSRKIAYQRQLSTNDTTAGLFVMDVASRLTQKVALTGARATAAGFSWVRDGRLVCVGSGLSDTPGEYSVYLVSLVGPPIQQVLATGFKEIPAATQSPDDSLMAIFGRRTGDTSLPLYLVKLDGANLLRLKDTGLSGWIAEWYYCQWVR